LEDIKKGKGDRSFGRPNLIPWRAWRNTIGVRVKSKPWGFRSNSPPSSNEDDA